MSETPKTLTELLVSLAEEGFTVSFQAANVVNAILVRVELGEELLDRLIHKPTIRDSVIDVVVYEIDRSAKRLREHRDRKATPEHAQPPSAAARLKSSPDTSRPLSRQHAP